MAIHSIVGMSHGSVTRPLTFKEREALWAKARKELMEEFLNCKETCFEAVQEAQEPIRSAMHAATLAGDELTVGRLAIKQIKDYCERLVEKHAHERFKSLELQYTEFNDNY